ALRAHGARKERLLEALGEIRTAPVTGENPEDTLQALEKFGRDLTQAAEDGKLDPVIGRDEEIRRVIQVLSRRTKNNPVLIGELRAIGATTLDEYRKHIEKDAALERRFQPVMVGEPTVEDAIAILRGLKPRYEEHHRVEIQDAALIAAATLSHRYIADRFLPDKAIDLIDESASRLRIELDSVPEEVDVLQRRIMQLDIELESLRNERDDASAERREAIQRERADLQEEADRLKAEWQAEREAVQSVTELKAQLEQTEHEIARAQREGDLQRAAELTYSKLPELRKQIAEAEER